jgi:hypothetical protein
MSLNARTKREALALVKALGLTVLGFAVIAALVAAGLWNAGLI